MPYAIFHPRTGDPLVCLFRHRDEATRFAAEHLPDGGEIVTYESPRFRELQARSRHAKQRASLTNPATYLTMGVGL